MEMARRYGEVARLLADTGLIVVSTTNPFGMAYAEAAQAIRTLVHPTPVISIQMSRLPDEASTMPISCSLVQRILTPPQNVSWTNSSAVVCWLKRLGLNPPSSIPSSRMSNRLPMSGRPGSRFDWLKTAVLPYHPYCFVLQ